MVVLITIGGFFFAAALTYLVGSRRPEVSPEERLARHQTVSLAELARLPATFGAALSGKNGKKGQERSQLALFVKPLLKVLAIPLAPSLTRTYVAKVEQQILMAGGFASLTAVEFVMLRVLLVAVGLVAVGAISGVEGGLMTAIEAGVMGWLLPNLLLKRKITARQKAIQRSLPDTIDLLTVSVEAGLGFDAAISRVSAKVTGPLSDELEHFLRSVRMGAQRRNALRDLAIRTGVADLNTFAVAIIQADQLGVSIGKVLRVQSDELRRKRRQRAEEAAMKAPIKMLFPLVGFIFPSLFIVLLGPAVIKIMGTFMNMDLGG